jgi:hypothetical protein
MKEFKRVPAHDLKDQLFPDCAKHCALIVSIRSGKTDCTSTCWWKFKDGKTLEAITVPSDTDIIIHAITKPKES